MNFLTGIGGALQVLLFGFGGLRLHERALAFDPLLPGHWQALRFPCLWWRGQALSVTVLPGDRAVIALERAHGGLTLELQRWRPGVEPLTVRARGLEGMLYTLSVEDWLVEPESGAEAGWRIWPPATGPAHPFVLLHLQAPLPGGSLVLDIEQRVLDGDL